MEKNRIKQNRKEPKRTESGPEEKTERNRTGQKATVQMRKELEPNRMEKNSPEWSALEQNQKRTRAELNGTENRTQCVDPVGNIYSLTFSKEPHLQLL